MDPKLTMDERDSEDSPSILYDLCFGYAKAEVLFGGVNLGIFEAISEKPMPYEEVAKKCDIDLNHLPKMLNIMCLLKLLKKNQLEDGSYVYDLSVTSRKYLIKESEDCLVDFIKFNELFKQFTSRVPEAVRTGKQVMYKEDKDMFGKLNNDGEMRKVFHGGMANISKTSKYMLDAFDLSEFKVCVDLGGSTGTTARNMKKMYPQNDVAVCDLPRVVDLARERPENKDADIKFIAGDFFKGDLPEADLYSMCHVIHDWDDPEAHMILESASKAIRPGGAVLILDSVFNEDKVGPPRVNFTEISQIVQHDGKHRTLGEFTALLEAHGFVDVQLKRWYGFGFYDAIFARKPKA